MGAPEEVGGRGAAPTAHERFKSRSRLYFWVGLGVASLLHLILFFWGLGFEIDEPAGGRGRQEMESIRLVPVSAIERREIRRPAPPLPPVERRRTRPLGEAVPVRRTPATPVVPRTPPPLPAVEPGEEIVEYAAPAAELAVAAPIVEVPPLPKPPEAGSAGAGVPAELREYRHVNALMQKPELVNRAQIRRALGREYPRELQRERVEGMVLVWFWIDEKGKVRHYEIRSSSGYAALDAAAERVIPKMKFRPAIDKGKPTPVIVALPIRFEVE